jgi:Ca2+:H+ antiporter
VVKALIVGSILGNILLVLGVSTLAGGMRRDRQNFEPRAASAQALLLLLATVVLVMPAIFELVQGPGLPSPRDQAVAYPADVLSLSVGVALVLLVSYAAGLLFSLKTHPHLFNPAHEEEDHGGEPWTVRRSVIMLAIAGAAVGTPRPRHCDRPPSVAQPLRWPTHWVSGCSCLVRQARRAVPHRLLGYA